VDGGAGTSGTQELERATRRRELLQDRVETQALLDRLFSRRRRLDEQRAALLRNLGRR
jgi:hypothetical protein